MVYLLCSAVCQFAATARTECGALNLMAVLVHPRPLFFLDFFPSENDKDGSGEEAARLVWKAW